MACGWSERDLVLTDLAWVVSQVHPIMRVINTVAEIAIHSGGALLNPPLFSGEGGKGGVLINSIFETS